MSVLPFVKATSQDGWGAVGGTFHIENVFPLVDGGRFPVKRIVGEVIEVWADIFRDGHDVVRGALLWRKESDSHWTRAPMVHHSNDRWTGSFQATSPRQHV